MKRLLLVMISSIFIFISCSSVSVTHDDGSHTTLYPDGRMERSY